MTYNPVGYDGGDPGIITSTCIATLSGGAAVTVSGATNVVTSAGIESFDPVSDMVALTAGASNFIGFVTQTAASGNPVSIATKGAFIVAAGSVVTVGADVEYIAASESFKAGATAGNVVGKAYTGAASGGSFVLKLQ